MADARDSTSEAASPTEIPSEDTSPADIPTIEPPEVPTAVPREEPTVIGPLPPEESLPAAPANSPPAVPVEPAPAEAPPLPPATGVEEPPAEVVDDPVAPTESANGHHTIIDTLLENALRDSERITQLLAAAAPVDAGPADAEGARAEDSAAPAAPASSSVMGPHVERFDPDPNNPHEMRLRRMLDKKNLRETGRKARKNWNRPKPKQKRRRHDLCKAY